MRPLGLGELLDRSITAYVRNAGVFLVVALLLYLPIGLLQIPVSGVFDIYLQALSGHPDPKSLALPPNLAQIEMLQLLVVGLVSPFVYGAGLYASQRVLQNQPVTIAEVFRAALRLYGKLMLLTFLLALVAAGAGFAMVLLLFLTGLIAAAAPALGFVLVLLAFAATLIGVLLLGVVSGVAFASCIVEGHGVTDALSLASARALNRATFWRSVLTGLILFAVLLGVALVFQGGAVALGLVLKASWIIPLGQTAGEVLEFGLIALLLMSYYLDLRVRREGLDLESAVNDLAPGPAAS